MRKIIVSLMFATLMAVVFVGCDKDKYESNTILTDGEATFSLKKGELKYDDGDELWCTPGIQNIFYIDNPTPGSYYTWNFCGTVFTGTVDNPQINMAYSFDDDETCVVTITEMPANVSISVTVYAAMVNPLIDPLYFLSSVQNTDGTWTYNFGVRKDRISDLTGTMFQIGDHTAWSMSYANISTTVSDSLIRFSFRSYNQMLKFNAGRGTTFSDVTGSVWAALDWPADNNYQVYLENGVVNLPTYSPTIVSPGMVGDNAGPFRATVDATNISLFLQVSNFVAGDKTNPYVNYKIGNGVWSGNVAMSWFNGYGWAQAPTIPLSSIPSGSIISVVYGATGGQASMGTSGFYVPSASCIQFQVTQVTTGTKGLRYEITKVE